MQKIAIIALILSMLSACTTHTEYGQCIGLTDDKDPNLIYKIDAMNMAMAIIFIETVIVPIKVIVDETLCPIGKKD